MIIISHCININTQKYQIDTKDKKDKKDVMTVNI